MRHQYRKPQIGRTRSHRKALFGNLSASLFQHRRIVTTLAKAKYARSFAERLITFARRGDLSARRHVARFIRDPEVVKKLFAELGPHFRNRPGGYTRIIKIGQRRGDAAPMAVLELVGFDDAATAPAPSPARKSRLKAAQQAAAEASPTAEKDTAGKKTKSAQAAPKSPRSSRKSPKFSAKPVADDIAAGESSPSPDEDK